MLEAIHGGGGVPGGGVPGGGVPGGMTLPPHEIKQEPSMLTTTAVQSINHAESY